MALYSLDNTASISSASDLAHCSHGYLRDESTVTPWLSVQIVEGHSGQSDISQGTELGK